MEKKVIKSMKDTLYAMNKFIDQPEFNNAGYVGEILMRLLENNKDLYLTDVEKYLRELNSRVYLLALPLSFFNQGEAKFISALPNENYDKMQENALWVCMNGEEETRDMMVIQNLTTELNLEKLKKCGFLMVTTPTSSLN